MPTSFYAITISFLVSGYLVLFTEFPIHLFIAPLVMLLYRGSLALSMVVSFCTGCFLDLVFLTPRFGFLGLSLALTAFALYDAKRYFFQQRAVTLFIMTFLFSEVYTVVQYLVAAICSLQMPLFNFIVDCLLMPLTDAVFSWVVFYVVPLCFRFSKHFFRVGAR